MGAVHPLARRTMTGPGEAWFGTLLMGTGLTFGTISSLYDLNAGIIERILVAFDGSDHAHRPVLVVRRAVRELVLRPGIWGLHRPRHRRRSWWGSTPRRCCHG